MSTPTISRRLLSRLHRDLGELREHPYPGVTVFTDDANIRRFCLVLVPPSGPWTGLALHFDVRLPKDWPSTPPSVASSVEGIDHPNLFGEYICCDLLKPMDSLQSGYTGGYTPALTLRGLFLQFLTFFSSTSVEQDYGGAIEIGDYNTTNFMQEKDLAPMDHCCHHRHPCGCQALEDKQRHLEKLWDADSSPEVIVAEYSAGSGSVVVHKVKGSSPSPSRIHKFEQRNPRWSSTLALIQAWSCPRCPYGSPELPHDQSQADTNTAKAAGGSPVAINAPSPPPPSCMLHILNDDILLDISTHMTSESLISFGLVYPRFHALMQSHHVLLQRELNCFFLKTPLNQCILGVGVAFDAGPRVLSSDFDWLSLEAFDEYNVRKSIEKRDFQFFLPLAFSPAHFERAMPEIWKRLGEIDRAVRQAETELSLRNRSGRGTGVSAAPVKPHDVFRVVYKIMNNIVVALMKSCDDVLAKNPRGRSSGSSNNAGLLHASERAVISYCHLMHLLICASRSCPAVLQDATLRLLAFLEAPANRTKAAVPDMGELIVAMTLVLIMAPADNQTTPAPAPNSTPANATLSWAMLNGPFLEEAITRNVRWVLKDAPELEIMEDGASEYRLAQTFAKSRTSLRLIMFQISFLELFRPVGGCAGVDIGALDDNYGFPQSELPRKVVEEVKAIYGVETWPAFFGRVRFGRAQQPGWFTRARFSEMLRSLVGVSRERGYHDPASRRRLENLRPVRKALEKAWADAQRHR